MENDLEKNPHLSNLRHISKLIQGENRQRLSTDLILSEIDSTKFSPIVSVDVERSFSVYTKHTQQSAPTADGRKFQKILITHA